MGYSLSSESEKSITESLEPAEESRVMTSGEREKPDKSGAGSVMWKLIFPTFLLLILCFPANYILNRMEIAETGAKVARLTEEGERRLTLAERGLSKKMVVLNRVNLFLSRLESKLLVSNDIAPLFEELEQDFNLVSGPKKRIFQHVYLGRDGKLLSWNLSRSNQKIMNSSKCNQAN